MLATVPKNTEPSARPLRMTHALALVAGAAGALIPACANPTTIAPITAQQAHALEVLSAHTEASRVLLERQVVASLEIQRIALTGRLHRELLTTGLLSPDLEAVPIRLEELLADAEQSSTLIEEVRLGRMRIAEAQAWLIDYALTCKMSQAPEAKRALLAQLSPIEQFEAGASALQHAVVAHGEAIQILVNELRADAQAIDLYAHQGELPTTWDRAKTRALIEQYVLARIDNPDRRDAAAELLDLLLTPWPAIDPTEGGAS
ncbi:MAG: hypothetical protein KDA20_03100 [Phycisphaerales bacterium]|nr:hypothetical protein [Phycisphaerales bacterium]